MNDYEALMKLIEENRGTLGNSGSVCVLYKTLPVAKIIQHQ
jgi:hypothetical protein